MKEKEEQSPRQLQKEGRLEGAMKEGGFGGLLIKELHVLCEH